MAPPKPSVVIRSIESAEARGCVDIFRRPDGTFGFEEWRRDPEDAGWRRIGHYGHAVFAGEREAVRQARSVVGWLGETFDRQG